MVDSRAHADPQSHLRLKLSKLKVSSSPAPLTVTANTAQKPRRMKEAGSAGNEASHVSKLKCLPKRPAKPVLPGMELVTTEPGNLPLVSLLTWQGSEVGRGAGGPTAIYSAQSEVSGSIVPVNQTLP